MNILNEVSMNKRMILLTILVAVVITGCSTKVLPEEIAACETICSGNKGLKYIFNSGSLDSDKCRCNNGVSISLTPAVIKDNTKKEDIKL